MQLALNSALIGVLVYACICLWVYRFHRRFVFVPQAKVLDTPSQFQVAYEEVWIPVSQPNGTVEKVNGWWIPTQIQQMQRQGTLLFLHGKSSNMGGNAPHAIRFCNLGFDVLLIDYRGYGKSEGGFPSEASVYQDAEAAWEYLTRDRKLSPTEIYVYGHSLGGAIATELVSHHPDVAGLILDSTFTSIVAVAAETPRNRLFPLKLLIHQRFDSLQKIKTISVPTLFIHGTADEVIPHQMSEQLFAAKSEPKQILLVPGANHNNVAATDWNAYSQAIRDFLKLAKPLLRSRGSHKPTPPQPSPW